MARKKTRIRTYRVMLSGPAYVRTTYRVVASSPEEAERKARSGEHEADDEEVLEKADQYCEVTEE